MTSIELGFLVSFLVILLLSWACVRLLAQVRFWRTNLIRTTDKAYNLFTEITECMSDLIARGIIEEDEVYAILMDEQRIARLFDDDEFRPLSASQELDKTLISIKQLCVARRYPWLSDGDIYRDV